MTTYVKVALQPDERDAIDDARGTESRASYLRKQAVSAAGKHPHAARLLREIGALRARLTALEEILQRQRADAVPVAGNANGRG